MTLIIVTMIMLTMTMMTIIMMTMTMVTITMMTMIMLTMIMMTVIMMTIDHSRVAITLMIVCLLLSVSGCSLFRSAESLFTPWSLRTQVNITSHFLP